MSLINLIVLITRRITFIIYIKENIVNKNSKFIIYTIILRIYFLLIQLFEYKYIKFNLSNSLIFSIFFTLTIFHIIHVILGVIIILTFLINKITFFYNYFIKIINTCLY